MKHRWWLLALLIVAASNRVPGAGWLMITDGDVIVAPDRRLPRPVPMPRPAPTALLPAEVTSEQATVTIQDQIATTRFDMEFYNPNSRRLEGSFLFPVPKGAAIEKFTLEINGQPVAGELLEAVKARGIFEEIVRKSLDPALLEYVGSDLLRLRVFPIEPQGRRRLTLSYREVLRADGGLVRYQLPLNTTKLSGRPPGKLGVKVDLQVTGQLKTLYSPSHTAEIRRHGTNNATLSFGEDNARFDRNFELIFSTDTAGVGVHLMTYQTGVDDGFFLLLAAPGTDADARTIVPRDLVFVLDTSGSMSGPKLEQARKALRFCVENLNPTDRFEVLRFATEVEGLFNGLQPADPAHRAQATKFIEGLQPLGGTAIADALGRALSLRPSGERPFVVIFLTDGLPTIGETDEQRIVAKTTNAVGGSTRIFCFGIGTDVNTHLLDRITAATRAASEYVLPTEDLELKLSGFYTKIREPVLTDLQLEVSPGIRLTKTQPQRLPDLFKGGQLLVVGRYQGSGPAAISLTGRAAGKDRRFAQDVHFGTNQTTHDFIPRLWATRRIGFLMDELRLQGEQPELKQEIVDLARRYNVVTPYTALLIVEDEARRGVAAATQTFRGAMDHPRRFDEYQRQARRLTTEKDGAAGVAGARSSSTLRLADSADPAINLSTADAGTAVTAPTDPAASTGAGRTFMAWGSAPRARSGPTSTQPGDLEPLASAPAPVFTGGRSFFLNGDRWIDSLVHDKAATPRLRIKFGSPEYFALLRAHPEVAPWLGLGRNLDFLLDGKIHEIRESSTADAPRE